MPRKTADYRYAFRGNYDREPKGVCRVRILEREGQPPTMILTELDENESTSVTNAVEILAAERIAKHFPQRFEEVGEDPVILVEHYPRRTGAGGEAIAATYDRVAFASWVPRRVWLGGQGRLSLETPDWRHIPPQEVKALIGDEAQDLGTELAG